MENKMGRSQSVFINKAIVSMVFVFTAILPINALNAQSSDTEKLKGTLVDAAVSKLNALGTAASEKASGERLKHISVSVFNNGNKTGGEATAVIKLNERESNAVFNQISISRVDGRDTANIGLGYRILSDNETWLYGANLFLDNEFSSGHKRWGLGVETLSNGVGVRANYYRALTDTRIYEGISETALDGFDYTISFKSDFAYNPEIYARGYNWSDGEGFKERGTEAGVNLTLSERLTLNVATDDSNRTNSVTKGILTYSFPFNEQLEPESTKVNKSSMRPFLYSPVKREKRIRKKRLVLGLVAVGT
jgi:adhesin/invasin